MERHTKQKYQMEPQTFAVESLLQKFHHDLDSVVLQPQLQEELTNILKQFNPKYKTLGLVGRMDKPTVLQNIVAGVYAPLIHGFSLSILKNISCGNLPNNILTPPRDAIPIAESISTIASLTAVDVNIVMPFLNRNTAGIANNQKAEAGQKSPYLDLHLHQVVKRLNGVGQLVELETGIYGTTSLEAAQLFKQNGIKEYFPIKLYGLGPNMSWVHAMLSGGDWIAEEAEKHTAFDLNPTSMFMVILDTMEELGMEKWYKSVEKLEEGSDGIIVPFIEPVDTESFEIAVATNQAVKITASDYLDTNPNFFENLLSKIPWLIEKSQAGLPLTLKSPIPAMDSKEEHFSRIRSSGLFDYPRLLI